MKKIILLLFVVAFYSCSSDSSDNNNTDIPSNEKLIHKINNGETAHFLYDGDRIVKGTVFTKYKQFVDNCFAICSRHALHAKTLGFIHPTTKKEMFFNSELPDDILQVIEKWRRYVTAKGIMTE